MGNIKIGGKEMARPNRDVTMHRDVLLHQMRKICEAIHLLSKKDSLNDYDIQAIKILLSICEDLSNPN